MAHYYDEEVDAIEYEQPAVRERAKTMQDMDYELTRRERHMAARRAIGKRKVPKE